MFFNASIKDNFQIEDMDCIPQRLKKTAHGSRKDLDLENI